MILAVNARHSLQDVLRIDQVEFHCFFFFILHLAKGYIQVQGRYVLLCVNVGCKITLHRLDLYHQEQLYM